MTDYSFNRAYPELIGGLVLNSDKKAGPVVKIKRGPTAAAAIADGAFAEQEDGASPYLFPGDTLTVTGDITIASSYLTGPGGVPAEDTTPPAAPEETPTGDTATTDTKEQ